MRLAGLPPSGPSAMRRVCGPRLARRRHPAAIEDPDGAVVERAERHEFGGLLGGWWCHPRAGRHRRRSWGPAGGRGSRACRGWRRLELHAFPRRRSRCSAGRSGTRHSRRPSGERESAAGGIEQPNAQHKRARRARAPGPQQARAPERAWRQRLLLHDYQPPMGNPNSSTARADPGRDPPCSTAEWASARAPDALLERVGERLHHRRGVLRVGRGLEQRRPRRATCRPWWAPTPSG